MLDRNEINECNAIANDARKRLNRHAALIGALPPESILSPDFGPSASLLDYCRKHDITLDWALLGEGPKYRSGATDKNCSMEVSGLAYDVCGMIEACHVAFTNEDLPFPKGAWGIGKTLEVTAQMAAKLIDGVELLEMGMSRVSKPVDAALDALAKARKIEDDACTRFNEMDKAGGIGNPEAQAYQVATVYPAQDVASKAMEALLDLPCETYGDFLRKVAALCNSCEDNSVYDRLRLDAERMIERLR